jgi:flagellar basal-body rod protein FlgF
MSDGIFTALSGSIATQHQLDTVSHNLANVSTPGFREQRLAFAEVLNNNEDLRMVEVEPGGTNMTPGAVLQTNDPLDLAVGGDGFFLVEGGAGAQIARSVRLSIDPDGLLTDASGRALLDPSGNPIAIGGSPDQLRIGSDGAIWSEFGVQGQLGIVSVVNPGAVQQVGAGLLQTNPGNLAPAEDAEVMQGYQESSNVNAVRGMAEMITLHRHFDAMQQLVQEHRKIDGRAIQTVGHTI